MTQDQRVDCVLRLATADSRDLRWIAKTLASMKPDQAQSLTDYLIFEQQIQHQAQNLCPWEDQLEPV